MLVECCRGRREVAGVDRAVMVRVGADDDATRAGRVVRRDRRAAHLEHEALPRGVVEVEADEAACGRPGPRLYGQRGDHACTIGAVGVVRWGTVRRAVALRPAGAIGRSEALAGACGA